MKILLVHPPWSRFFQGNLTTPPVALSSIATYIKRELPEVDIDVYNADHTNGIDRSFNSYHFARLHNTYLERLNNFSDPIWHDIESIIADYNPDILGISAMTASYVSALNVSKIAKRIKPEMTVVLGGKHPSALPEDTLKNAEVDFVVIGEGEETFADLIRNIDSPENVKGIAFKNSSGEIIKTYKRPYIADIDKLPLPLFHSAINTYDFVKKINLESLIWKIVSARGCPFRCIYCASDKNIRYRSPQNVIDEVVLVKKKLGINSFSFQDDSFSIKKDRVLEFCDMLKRERVSWDCNTRVDLIDEDVLKEMKQSGCTVICVGIESGSEKTLNHINKGISLKKIYDSISLLKSYKFLVKGFFMIGFPWETSEDMEKTLDLIRKLPIDSFELNLATPLPGTQMFRALVEEGKINIETEDWSKYHQGSPDMNFSHYPDSKWKETILGYTYKASKIHNKMFLRRNLKSFCKDPIGKLKKIRNRFVAHINAH